MASAFSASPDEPCRAPADYAELAEVYGGRIRSLIAKQLGPRAKGVSGMGPVGKTGFGWTEASPDDVDDFTQRVFEKFRKNDVIGQYEPDVISEHTGRPVNFWAFIAAKVALYCLGFREELGRRRARETPVDTGATEGPGSWTALLGGRAVWGDEYPSLDEGAAWDRLMDWLAANPPEPGKVPLFPLAAELVRRAASGEPTGPVAVQKWAGLPLAAAREALAELRGRMLAAASGEAPGPVPGHVIPGTGTELSAAELRTVVDALRAAPGNQVLHVFRQCGSPLAGAGTKWYLPFARAELRWFPGLKGSRGGHYAGGHGRSDVKSALIHRLERMLYGIPDPPPHSPPPPAAEPAVPDLDHVEAQLWRLPGATAASVDAALEAVRLAFGLVPAMEDARDPR